MFLHEDCSSRLNSTHIGDNDYTSATGRLEDAGVLHYTNYEDAKDLFNQFDIDDITKQITFSEHLSSSSQSEVVAWNIISCRK